jgi:hypothetical protein
VRALLMSGLQPNKDSSNEINLAQIHKMSVNVTREHIGQRLPRNTSTDRKQNLKLHFLEFELSYR